MASKRFSALPAASVVADDDLLVMTDVSDLSDGANGTTKRVSADVLRSSFGSDVGWLEVRPSLDIEDWQSLDEGATLEDGILTSSVGVVPTLTGDGLDLWTRSETPFWYEFDFRIKLDNVDIDDTYLTIPANWYAGGSFVIGPEITLSGLSGNYHIQWTDNYQTTPGAPPSLSFSSVPTDWFAITTRGLIASGWRTVGLDITGTDGSNEFNYSVQGSASFDSCSVDLNNTVLRIKPW